VWHGTSRLYKLQFHEIIKTSESKTGLVSSSSEMQNATFYSAEKIPEKYQITETE